MSFFGSINRLISRLDAESEPQKSGINGAYGFQVLRNKNVELRLEPWFDHIIGINGRTIDNPDASLFATEVKNCAGQSISLGIWSAKGQRIRELYVTVPADATSLGLSLQWAPLANTEDVWRILDVTTNSPADVAGLLPYSDYVIGSPDGLIRGESGLPELIENYAERPLRLLVYNHEYDVTRPITITPSRNWGGQGALGCILGFGALHRVPAPLEEPPQAPGETLFDFSKPADEKSALAAADAAASLPPAGDFLVPANMQLDGSVPAPSNGASVGKPKKARAHHDISPGKGLDEYFAEGEAKSKEQDFAPKSKGSGLAPPPKSGKPAADVPLSASPPKEDDDVD